MPRVKIIIKSFYMLLNVLTERHRGENDLKVGVYIKDAPAFISSPIKHMRTETIRN